MSRRKMIRIIAVRCTTIEEKAITDMARADGLPPSTFLRELAHAEMRRRGVLAPLVAPSAHVPSSPAREDA